MSEQGTEGGRAVERLRESEQALEGLHQITSDDDLGRDEKLDRMLAVGCDRLGTAYGFLTEIDGETQRVIRSVGDNPEFEPGSTAPLSEAYCRKTIGEDDPLAVTDAMAEGWESDPAYRRFGLGCYLGTTIRVDGEQYGTVCFADSKPRDRSFTDREATFIELLTNWVQTLLEREQHERELGQQRAFLESMMDSLPDPLYAFDESGHLTLWNHRLETVTGYTPSELDTMRALELVADEDRDRVESTLSEVWGGERVSMEIDLETSHGDYLPYNLSAGPLHDESGEIIGITGVGRDTSEEREYRSQLSGMLDTTRSLMQARDREHVAEITINAARKILGYEIGVFRLYDSEAGTLEPSATTERAVESMGDRPIYGIGEGNPGEVFASGEPRIVDDTRREEFDLGEIRSLMYHPVGVHGVISIGAPEPEAFDENDRQVLGLLATAAGAACMRAKREREVREAREHTERVLDRVNGLLQDTIEVLVQATTREELETGVVRELAAAEPYSFALVGQPDVANETISPTAWDGHAALPMDELTVSLDRAGEPMGEAYRTGRPQHRSTGDWDDGPWAEFLGSSHVEALFAVPLVYKETSYGVVVVFAEEEAAFDEREQVVLEALGRAIANAINAVERGRILDATEIIELEFGVDDRELLFSRLSARSDCRIEVSGTDYRADGAIRLYLTAAGGDSETLLELLGEDPAVRSVTCIIEDADEALFEVELTESLLAQLAEYGAVPQSVTAQKGRVKFTVELPYQAEARELFELVETQYGGTDLLGYHERERPVETRQEFRAALFDRFTDRQETALQTAYLGGFFNWPRDVDGNELAEAMDISRPTYHQHLRSAQKKVFQELFE